jgi:hypothetical protein
MRFVPTDEVFLLRAPTDRHVELRIADAFDEGNVIHAE